MQKLLRLIRSQLFIFAFISSILEVGHRGACCDLCQRVFCLCLGVLVSGLTFRSLIHFEFIFVYGVIKCSSFILLQVVGQFSQHHLLKRLDKYFVKLTELKLMFDSSRAHLNRNITFSLVNNLFLWEEYLS